MKLLLTIFIFWAFTLNAQNRFELGFSFGPNAGISKTIVTENSTWGYRNAIKPFLWTNHFYFGWGSKKNRILFSYDFGSVNVTWKIDNYSNKYPLINYLDEDAKQKSMKTHLKYYSLMNVDLQKFSFNYKLNLYSKNNFSHKGHIGFAFFKTSAKKININDFAISGFYNDTLGDVINHFVQDKFSYLRETNLILTLGYQFTYTLKERWNFNLNFNYNQGVYKMLKWHTYRTFTESNTGYSEYDHQWSFSRLSYFEWLVGVSYDIGGYKKKEKVKNRS